MELLVFEGGEKTGVPGENPLGAKERTNKLRGQDEANPTFRLATRAGKGLVIFLSRSPRSFSPFTLTLALHAHSRASRSLSRFTLALALHARSRARPCALADVFEKNGKKKKTKFLYRLAKDPILLWIDQGKVLFFGSVLAK